MCPAGDPINQGQVEWSFPDPRIAQLDAAVADYKAAWERDVRLNAELRAKQEADLAAAKAEAGAYRALLNEAAAKLPAKHGDLIEAIDETLARFATPAADPQVGKDAP